MSYKARPVGDVRDLLDACCRSDPRRKIGSNVTNVVSGQTLAAGQTTVLYAARQGDGDAGTYANLDSEGRFNVAARACYYSVLDECWITDFRRMRPRSVARCPARPSNSW